MFFNYFTLGCGMGFLALVIFNVVVLRSYSSRGSVIRTSCYECVFRYHDEHASLHGYRFSSLSGIFSLEMIVCDDLSLI